MMKRIISIILALLMVVSFAACGKETASKKRKRAGKDTVTNTASSDNSTVMDTGVLRALDKTYAKSDKYGLVYDPNIFINMQNDKSSVVKVACVGDSITYGTLASNPEKASYPVELQKLLDSKYKGRYSVKNYGKPSAYVAEFPDRTASLLYRNTEEFKQLKKDKPDAVIIMLGTNDTGYLTTKENVEKFKSDFKSLLNEIKSIKSSPVVYVCTPLVKQSGYSYYVNMPMLRSIEIEIANKCGAYVIDTNLITKQYFGSYLYETDCLHPTDAGYKYLAKTIYNGVVSGLTAYSESKVAPTSDYVVYVDSSKGSYDSVGATPDKPTSSFARAVELCRGGGTIVVSGPVTPATTIQNNIVRLMITPENDYPITVTSIDPYNGTDYRNTNGAVIYMSASMYLNGDYEFKSVNFDTVAAGVKFVCNYHNVTMGTGINCSYSAGGYFVFICGHDVVTAFQSENDISCNKDCTITIKSGTYAYIKGGNFRTYSSTTNTNTYNYGTIKSGVTYTLNISGGTFSNTDSGNINVDSGRLTTIIGANSVEKGAKVNCNISGGIFKGSVFATSRFNPYNGNAVPAIAGDISVNVTGGVFLGSDFNFLQTYSGALKPNVTGTYNLNISGGTFASGGKKNVSSSGCANSVLTLSGTGKNLSSWATISGFKTVK